MSEAKTLVLSADMRTTWAKAGKIFLGQRLDEVLTRTLADFSNDRAMVEFYEIRRRDVPTVFDSLLKLQNTGYARRYIETDETEFREVLKVEVSLLNAIMVAIALILDVILGTVLPKASDGSASLPSTVSGTPPPTIAKPYVPSWKRESKLIGYEGPSL
jgi:hypothetical protein